MQISKDLEFKFLEEKGDYVILYTVVKSDLSTGNEKTIFIVMKGNMAVFISDPKLDQFHAKLSCEEFIEEQLKQENLIAEKEKINNNKKVKSNKRTRKSTAK